MYHSTEFSCQFRVLKATKIEIISYLGLNDNQLKFTPSKVSFSKVRYGVGVAIQGFKSTAIKGLRGSNVFLIKRRGSINLSLATVFSPDRDSAWRRVLFDRITSGPNSHLTLSDKTASKDILIHGFCVGTSPVSTSRRKSTVIVEQVVVSYSAPSSEFIWPLVSAGNHYLSPLLSLSYILILFRDKPLQPQHPSPTTRSGSEQDD